MSLAAKCETTCTTPQHGFVARDREVVFDLPEWDLKKFPYLKHFTEKKRAKNPQPTIDEGATAVANKAAAKASTAAPLGVSAPEAAVEAPMVKKLSGMTPEELDNVGPEALVAVGKLHGVELDVNTDRTDLLIAAIDAEDNASELFE